MRTSGLILLIAGMLACDDKGDVDTGSNDNVDTTVDVDADEDGYPEGDDCNDGDAAINPGATEVCDGVDNNCDGAVDEGVTVTYYADTDSDGYGDSSDSVDACSAPSGYVEDGTDCDDTTGDVNPDVTEVCDEIDNNCDGSIDEGVLNTYYTDDDGDGFGDEGSTLEACVMPKEGYTTVAGDCNDLEATVNPDQVEVCDGLDNDCDKTTTEDGTISFNDGKSLSDITSDFSAGTEDAPITVLLEEAGSVRFCGGTWYANVVITTDVDLHGDGAVDENVLHGANGGPVVSWIQEVDSESTSTIEALTLKGGSGRDGSTFGSGFPGGGGGFCDGGFQITMDNVVISENTANLGAGLYVHECDTSINDSEFHSNVATYYGGGIFNVDSSSMDLTDTNVFENSAGYYGGGMMHYSNEGEIALDMVDSQIHSNIAEFYGGGMAVFAFNKVTTITAQSTKKSKNRCSVHNNSAGYSGGGIEFYGSNGDILVNDCDFGDSKTGDNTPEDIYNYSWKQQSYYFGLGVSFNCDASGCYEK